ncbi:hypothetical protein HK099_006537 [Clydaea vesicula]|uniref:Nascent polypeptide-associated complex subunit alpha-like UBA domain-containing protein n=1 Tax=Clydaea vesicula TaxID=447962 RepID=A0AAD5U670_9FUNG|nr:hypothetical protein HK099_006537 [Clydaea vesicula]
MSRRNKNKNNKKEEKKEENKDVKVEEVIEDKGETANDIDKEEENEKGQRAEANKDLGHMYQEKESKADIDETKLYKAMTSVIKLHTDLSKTRTKATSQSQLESSKIVINKEDVELLVKELNLSKVTAEKSLKDNNGDLVLTMKTLIKV